MNLEQLLDQWDKDCIISDDHLDSESVKTPKLHSKYLRLLIQHKMKLTALTLEYSELRTKKFRYYRGEMGKVELAENGWDQWQGAKLLKADMNEFLDGDVDLHKITIKCEYIKGIVEALESIMNQIKSRNWEIRNSIEWKKFLAGA